MADLEAVLADVSYLMAMEKSKSCPAARASKKIILPDPRYILKFIMTFWPHLKQRPFLCSVRWVMHKYLEKNGDATFEKIFHQVLGKFLIQTVASIDSWCDWHHSVTANYHGQMCLFRIQQTFEGIAHSAENVALSRITQNVAKSNRKKRMPKRQVAGKHWGSLDFIPRPARLRLRKIEFFRELLSETDWLDDRNLW